MLSAVPIAPAVASPALPLIEKSAEAKRMTPEEREKWRELKQQLQLSSRGKTNAAVIQMLANMCRTEEGICDKTTYKVKAEGKKPKPGGHDLSFWQRRFMRTSNSDDYDDDDDDDDDNDDDNEEGANLFTKYAKRKAKPDKTKKKELTFSENVQDVLLKMTAQFGEQINVAYDTEPASKTVQQGNKNPLQTMMKMHQIDENMKAIDQDMQILKTKKDEGHTTATEFFVGFAELGEDDYMEDEDGSEESSECSDESESDSDDDDSDYDSEEDNSSIESYGDLLNDLGNQMGIFIQGEETSKAENSDDMVDFSVVRSLAYGAPQPSQSVPEETAPVPHVTSGLPTLLSQTLVSEGPSIESSPTTKVLPLSVGLTKQDDKSGKDSDGIRPTQPPASPDIATFDAESRLQNEKVQQVCNAQDEDEEEGSEESDPEPNLEDDPEVDSEADSEEDSDDCSDDSDESDLDEDFLNEIAAKMGISEEPASQTQPTELDPVNGSTSGGAVPSFNSSAARTSPPTSSETPLNPLAALLSATGATTAALGDPAAKASASTGTTGSTGSPPVPSTNADNASRDSEIRQPPSPETWTSEAMDGGAFDKAGLPSKKGAKCDESANHWHCLAQDNDDDITSDLNIAAKIAAVQDENIDAFGTPVDVGGHRRKHRLTLASATPEICEDSVLLGDRDLYVSFSDFDYAHEEDESIEENQKMAFVVRVPTSELRGVHVDPEGKWERTSMLIPCDQCHAAVEQHAQEQEITDELKPRKTHVPRGKPENEPVVKYDNTDHLTQCEVADDNSMEDKNLFRVPEAGPLDVRPEPKEDETLLLGWNGKSTSRSNLLVGWGEKATLSDEEDDPSRFRVRMWSNSAKKWTPQRILRTRKGALESTSSGNTTDTSEAGCADCGRSGALNLPAKEREADFLWSADSSRQTDSSEGETSLDRMKRRLRTPIHHSDSESEVESPVRTATPRRRTMDHTKAPCAELTEERHRQPRRTSSTGKLIMKQSAERHHHKSRGDHTSGRHRSKANRDHGHTRKDRKSRRRRSKSRQHHDEKKPKSHCRKHSSKKSCGSTDGSRSDGKKSNVFENAFQRVDKEETDKISPLPPPPPRGSGEHKVSFPKIELSHKQRKHKKKNMEENSLDTRRRRKIRKGHIKKEKEDFVNGLKLVHRQHGNKIASEIIRRA